MDRILSLPVQPFGVEPRSAPVELFARARRQKQKAAAEGGVNLLKRAEPYVGALLGAADQRSGASREKFPGKPNGDDLSAVPVDVNVFGELAPKGNRTPVSALRGPRPNP